MRSRSVLFAGLLGCFVLALAACQHHTKHVEKSSDMPPPTPMAVGETRFFAFPADGEWNSSGILVLAGDTFTVEPLGLAAGLEEGDLQYRAGNDGWPLYTYGNQPVKFETMGPLEFKARCENRKYVSGMLEVLITKESGPENGTQGQLK